MSKPKTQGRKAKAKSKRASRGVRKATRKASGGSYTLTIEGQGTTIKQEIDAGTMARIVKLVF